MARTTPTLSTLGALVLAIASAPCFGLGPGSSPGNGPACRTLSGTDLELRVQASPTAFAEGDGFTAKVVFTNRGAEELRFHLPEFSHMVPFPRWIVRRDDGAEFSPTPPSFQSGWTLGLQGEIVKLAPGATHSLDYDFTTFIPDGVKFEDLRALTPLPLAEGKYELLVDLDQPKDLVPHGAPGFQRVMKPYAGLWTGHARSAPVALEVGAPVRPLLRIHAPREATPGRPYPLEVSLRNPTDQPLQLEGAFELEFFSMGQPRRTARISLDERGTPLAAGEASTRTIPAGVTVRWSLDAASYRVHQTGRDARAFASFTEAHRQGLFHLHLQVADTAEKRTLGSNGLSRYVTRTGE